MTADDVPPKVENAPGLVFRKRKVGWAAVWQARTDLVQRGYRPPMVPLWRGAEPSEADKAMISDQCNSMQSEMLVWGRGGIPQVGTYDGTIHSLVVCFQTDPDSPYHKLRYRSKENYRSLLGRIDTDHGTDRVQDLRAREMLRWHEAWAARGTAMAHSLIRMARSLFSFGMTLLECEECTRMCTVMAKQRFQMGKPRSERLTSDQANLIRTKAHEMGLHSVALAQAIQFECTLRQKDVIGEWVPASEPGLSDVTHDGEKWLRGLRWNEIDESLIIHHVTSKRQKMVEPDLRLAPMVLEELNLAYGLNLAEGLMRSKLPASGPVIVFEDTGHPYQAHTFRRVWRTVARACGIPDAVYNMDSRAGAISEATDAGADLESVRHAATHSNISTTQNYSRGGAEKTAAVMQKRVAFRQNKSGT